MPSPQNYDNKFLALINYSAHDFLSKKYKTKITERKPNGTHIHVTFSQG